MREEDIPIDINYNKLLDWLIDRRHCNLKWQQSVSPIKQKIQKTSESLTEIKKVSEILREPSLNYFHCKEVKKCLEESGEGTKTIFGQYSSQLMKAWDEILHQYENGNVYLAEAAAELMRNVNYEIPSLKKKIAKAQQTQRDCTRKEAEYMANAASCKEKYLQSCLEMGIKGDDVQRELLNLITQLPNIHAEVAEKVRGLRDAIDYYRTFTRFVVSSASEPEAAEVTVVPLLSFIAEHGNVTVHHWLTGEKLQEKAKEVSAETAQNEESKLDGVGDQIDWGDLDTMETTQTLETGTGVELASSSPQAIDLGESLTLEGIDFGDSVLDNSIDWSSVIEVVDSSGNATDKDCKGSGEPKESFSETQLQKESEDRLLVLDGAKTRNQFLDELIELMSFLNQRKMEMGLEADVISVNQFQNAPVLIQLQNRERVSAMQYNVTKIVDEMSSVKMKNLYLLKGSERFVHRIADALQQKLKIAENTIGQARMVADRRKEALQLQRDCEPLLQALILKTKKLQKQIAAEISKKYKNRIVNIMGDINTI